VVKEVFGTFPPGAAAGPGQFRGQASMGAQTGRWDLAIAGGQPPLRPLRPPVLYRAPLPRTKLEATVPDDEVTGTLGVGDPMSSDNVDFEILEPLALAVAGVTFLALLFGVTFAALATRFDAAVKPLTAGPGQIWKHLPLILIVVPPIAVIAVVYVLLRVVLHGRTRATLDGPAHKPGMIIVGLGALAAGVASVAAAVSIL